MITWKYRVSFVIIIIIWFFFVSATLINYSDDNPIKLRYSISNTTFKSLMPQGWAFFTRNAREERIEIFQIGVDTLYIDPRIRQGSLNNLFGVKRTARSLSVEVAYLISKTPNDSSWGSSITDKEVLFQAVNNGSLKSVDVINKTKNPLLTGKILVIRTETVPWAWAKNYKKVSPPFKTLLLNVKNI